MTKIKNNIFKDLPAEILKKLKKTAQPKSIKPMLATLTQNYFSSKDWIYEHKFDGVRCVAFKKNGKVSLMSRNNNIMNTEYPEIVSVLEKDPADDFVIDGEIVAIGKTGISDFQLLQGRINLKQENLIEERQKKIEIIYRIFDLIYCSGFDTTKLPLIFRKKVLKKLLKFNKLLSFSEHKIGDGVKFFHQACRLHWEGLIAKKKDSEYVETRSPNWLKFKCAFGQELVIGGFTEPEGSRSYFGALLVGYYDKDKFMYAGKVGTGFSYAMLEILGKKLNKLEISKCPFQNFEDSTRNIHWVSPKLVGEFEFAQWTRGGKLRVGRFKGLRTDKKATDVIKETPKSVILKK